MVRHTGFYDLPCATSFLGNIIPAEMTPARENVGSFPNGIRISPSGPSVGEPDELPKVSLIPSSPKG